MESFFRVPFKLFSGRLALRVIGVVEAIIVLALAITIVFDFYLSLTYAYILFFEVLHLFSWAFVVATGCMQLDAGLTTATTVVYIINFLLDLGSTIWRVFILANLSVSAGVLALYIIIFILVLFLLFEDLLVVFFAWSMLYDIQVYRNDIFQRLSAFWDFERLRVQREQLQATAITLNTTPSVPSAPVYDPTFGRQENITVQQTQASAPFYERLYQS